MYLNVTEVSEVIKYVTIISKEKRSNIFGQEIVTPMDLLLFRLFHRFRFPNGT